ncbi:reverse transcriptase domain-containing protein [Escherichia coli]|uniref:reverse transcriptase domain-containing protein n=1 Tax=Escherichia coli TaxID=562 RepID=UPI000DA53495|nr:reverse transcriptase domain-containing protein [Escherichia coli]SQN62575.1 RNA-directed DNA polymerase (reverse transcriptase) domain protein [Escherichia coli]
MAKGGRLQRCLKLRGTRDAKRQNNIRHHPGTPQGGIISPLLSNIYLNKLDQYVEHVLLPKYNKGKSRARNREYEVQNGIEHYNRKRGRLDISRAARKKKQTLPSKDPFDPHYRRLRYVRYADDFLLGFSGPKSEAEEIKKEITLFLQNNLSLEVSQEKTCMAELFRETRAIW